MKGIPDLGVSKLSFPRMWDLGIFIDSSIFDLLLRCSEKVPKISSQMVVWWVIYPGCKVKNQLKQIQVREKPIALVLPACKNGYRESDISAGFPGFPEQDWRWAISWARTSTFATKVNSSSELLLTSFLGAFFATKKGRNKQTNKQTNKTKQNKTKQNKTKQNKTKQNKTNKHNNNWWCDVGETDPPKKKNCLLRMKMELPEKMSLSASPSSSHPSCW